MTVTGSPDEGWTIQCHWFDAAGEEHHGVYPAAALEAETPRPAPDSRPVSYADSPPPVHLDYYRR